jgi:hypothetical protein
MDGSLLKRLGPDVMNYYLYLIKRVNQPPPILRIIPPHQVFSNLDTEVRFRFPITKKNLVGVNEILL